MNDFDEDGYLNDDESGCGKASLLAIILGLAIIAAAFGGIVWLTGGGA